jgi:hypothetical protein
MERSYGVVWREGTHQPVSGKLELLPRAMRFEGLYSLKEIPYDLVAAVRIGRLTPDRIDGQPSIIVERRAGDPITIGAVAKPSVVGEIAERLAALQLDAQAHRRVVVVVPLNPEARESVRALLEVGPPFDPEEIRGLDRHDVFLAANEAVFVFESHLGADALTPLLTDPKLWEAAASWHEYVAGPPQIAEDVFSWSRSLSEPREDVSFLPTPGPGDSDGGDIF